MRSARTYARMAIQYMVPRLAANRIIKRDLFAEPELKVLPSLIDCSRSALDVGAHIGHYTRALAPLVPQVFAFEAHPRMARMLKASVPSNVTVRSLAISDTNGSAQLSVPWIEGRHEIGLSSIERENSASRPQDHELMVVKTIPLDDIDLPGIGFIKIDVEGHELHVLRGARRLIKRETPVMLIEVEERHRSDALTSVRHFISEHGYKGIFVHHERVHDIDAFDQSMQDAAMLSSNGSYVNNFIFIPLKRFDQVASSVDAALQDIVAKRKA